MSRDPLTTSDGPVFASEPTMRALLAIRREKLLAQMYGRIALAASVSAAMLDVWPQSARPDWLDILPDAPGYELPARVTTADASDAATLRSALAHGASLVLLEGAIKDRAKLSYIKSAGAVAMLVQAHQQGLLSAVPPMLKALRALGQEHVLPPPEQLEALLRALGQLE